MYVCLCACFCATLFGYKSYDAMPFKNDMRKRSYEQYLLLDPGFPRKGCTVSVNKHGAGDGRG